MDKTDIARIKTGLNELGSALGVKERTDVFNHALGKGMAFEPRVKHFMEPMKDRVREHSMMSNRAAAELALALYTFLQEQDALYVLGIAGD